MSDTTRVTRWSGVAALLLVGCGPSAEELARRDREYREQMAQIEARQFARFREARANEGRAVTDDVGDAGAEDDLREYARGFVGASWYAHVVELRVASGAAEAQTDLYPDGDADEAAEAIKRVLLGWARGADGVNWVRVYGSDGSVIASGRAG